MAAQLGLVLDCAEPERLAGFWSAAIGYTTIGGAGSYVLLVDEAKQRPKLLLQRVDEPKPGEDRMHVGPPSGARSRSRERTACPPTPGPPTARARGPASRASAPAGSRTRWRSTA